MINKDSKHRAPIFAKFSSSELARLQELMQITEKQFLLAVLAGVATLGSAFALAAVSGFLITKAWTMPPVLDLSIAVVMVRALGISRAVFRYFERLLTHDAALSGVARLRTNLYSSLTHTAGANISRLKRGNILSRLGDDAEEMANDVIRFQVPLMVALFMAVIATSTIFPFSPLAAGSMLLAQVIATFIAPAFAFRAGLILEDEVLEARNYLAELTMEAIESSDTLLVRGKWDKFSLELQNAQRTYDLAIDKAVTALAISRAGVQLALIPAVIGSILAAGAVYNEWSLSGLEALSTGFMGTTAGIIGVIVLLPLSSFEAAMVLPLAAQQRARSLQAAKRLAKLDARALPIALALEDKNPESSIRAALRSATEQAVDIHEADKPKDLESTSNHSSTSPSTAKSRQITAVDFKTKGLVIGYNQPLNLPLDLNLPSGTRLLIYGSSGRGKSTLALSLAGLLEPLNGEIEAATDQTSLNLTSAVKYFAEDAHIFNTSLRQNLKVVNPELSDEELHAALGAVSLETWFNSLPSGLDTILGANAEDVSGGERRRLLLARALLMQSPITILDEPTEHLDSSQAKALMNKILTPGEFFSPAQTVIVITHDERFKDSAKVLDLDDFALARIEE